MAAAAGALAMAAAFDGATAEAAPPPTRAPPWWMRCRTTNSHDTSTSAPTGSRARRSCSTAWRRGGARAERGLPSPRDRPGPGPPRAVLDRHDPDDRGRLREASELLDEAIEIARVGGHAQGMAWNLFARSFAATAAGDTALALARRSESVAAMRGSSPASRPAAPTTRWRPPGSRTATPRRTRSAAGRRRRGSATLHPRRLARRARSSCTPASCSRSTAPRTPPRPRRPRRTWRGGWGCAPRPRTPIAPRRRSRWRGRRRRAAPARGGSPGRRAAPAGPATTAPRRAPAPRPDGLAPPAGAGERFVRADAATLALRSAAAFGDIGAPVEAALSRALAGRAFAAAGDTDMARPSSSAPPLSSSAATRSVTATPASASCAAWAVAPHTGARVRRATARRSAH